jgi:hypothetical protein
VTARLATQITVLSKVVYKLISTAHSHKVYIITLPLSIIYTAVGKEIVVFQSVGK